MKVLLLAIFFFSPFLQAKASTPKAATCTRKEYREEYIPGTQSSPGYVKNYVVDIEIPCGGEQAQKVDDNDCREGSVIGGLLGAGIALSSTKGKNRFGPDPLKKITKKRIKKK